MLSRRTLTVMLLASSLGLIGAAEPASSPTNPPSAAEGLMARADDLFVAGRFTEAAEAFERSVADHPEDASALASLARIKLYENRHGEAAALAQKATALSPENALAAQVLKTAKARQTAFGPDVFQLDTAMHATSVQFVTTDPLPVVEVQVDGRPAKFFIDTGAPDIALTPEFAKSLGLSLADAGVGVFAGGRKAEVQRTRANDFEIGGVHFKNVPAVISPVALPEYKTDGVIGAGLFMHVLATIDYCRGRLILAPRSTSPAFERHAAATGANINPMWLVGDHFVFAWGEINQTEGLFSIDTGLAGGGLVATRATVETAHIPLDTDKAGVGQGGGGAVHFVPFHADARLGALARNNVSGSYMADGDPYGGFKFRVAGALSHDFFRQSRLTFDFDAMKLVTERCR